MVRSFDVELILFVLMSLRLFEFLILGVLVLGDECDVLMKNWKDEDEERRKKISC